jgi:hypothetical protein
MPNQNITVIGSLGNTTPETISGITINASLPNNNFTAVSTSSTGQFNLTVNTTGLTGDQTLTVTASSITNKFGVVVRIQNSLTTSQTRNLTLYFDTAGFTVSGDPQSALVTLSSGQTEKIWNVTVGSSVSDGTHYAYVRLGDNTAAATYSFTVTSTTATTTVPPTTTTAPILPSIIPGVQTELIIIVIVIIAVLVFLVWKFFIAKGKV